jgi:hypothetical protein
MPLKDRTREVEANRRRRAGARDIGAVPPVRHPSIKRRLKGDLLGFLRRYFAHRFPLPFSRDHLGLIASLQGIIRHGGLRALAMPRGSGKTTILEAAALWALLYGHRQFLFIVAATGKDARKILANIQAELQFNDALHEDYPEATHAVRALGGVSRRAEAQTCDGAPTHLVWTRDAVRLPATAAGGGSVIAIAGMTGAIRGAKQPLADGRQVRPDLCLVDDFQTRASAKSASQVRSRLDILAGDVLGLAGPGKRVACLCACTIILRGDGADQLLDRKARPEWQGTTARLMNSMPAPSAQAHWDKYEEIYKEDLRRDDLPQERRMERATTYYRAHRAAMDAGADPAWPERFAEGEASAIQHAMNLRIERGDAAFFAEFQNQPKDADAAEVTPYTVDTIAARLNRLPPGIVPSGARELVAFVDVGEGCLWWSVAAFADGFAGDLVAYGAYPDPARRQFFKVEMAGALKRAHPTGSMQATWFAALSALCAKMLDPDWMDEDGTPHRISLCLIDAGYGESTDTVFDFCKRSPWKDRLMPSRGVGIGAKKAAMADWKKSPGERIGTDWRIRRNAARRQLEVMIGTNFWKSFVAARLAAPMGGPGCLRLCGSDPAMHEMIARHLTAEKRVPVSAMGRTVDEWLPKPGQDNDLFDTVVGCHVAASIRGIGFDPGRPTGEAPRRVSLAALQKAAREGRKG